MVRHSFSSRCASASARPYLDLHLPAFSGFSKFKPHRSAKAADIQIGHGPLVAALELFLSLCRLALVEVSLRGGALGTLLRQLGLGASVLA
jgi:hypothetical protein